MYIHTHNIYYVYWFVCSLFNLVLKTTIASSAKRCFPNGYLLFAVIAIIQLSLLSWFTNLWLQGQKLWIEHNLWPQLVTTSKLSSFHFKGKFCIVIERYCSLLGTWGIYCWAVCFIQKISFEALTLMYEPSKGVWITFYACINQCSTL